MMGDLQDLTSWIDRVMEVETKRFLDEVPFASHLTDLDQELDGEYYVRHRVETVKRIRMTAKTDALALAKMIDEDYSAAREWSKYLTEELGHDVLYLRDLQEHGMTEEEVFAIEPFPATIAMLEYLTEQIERLGSLPAVTYSVFVEWSSERYSTNTVVKAERSFSASHVSGSKSHVGIDEDEDHYQMMLDVINRLLPEKDGKKVLLRLMEEISAFFRDYFRQLYEVTVTKRESITATT